MHHNNKQHLCKAAPTAQPQQQQPETDGSKSPEPGDAQQQTAEIMGTPTSEGAVVVFGRFNPPTTGHEKLLKSANTEASRTGADLRIYPSRSVDAKKNPLQAWNKDRIYAKDVP